MQSRSLSLKCLPLSLALLILCPLLARAADYPTHPLDSLSREEILTTVEILKAGGKTTDASRYATIMLREPPKAEVLAFKPGSAFRREAFAVVYERATNKTFEAVVDLNKKALLSWKEAPGVQPAFLIEDLIMAEQIVKADPQWQAAMRKRGITDFKNVNADAWASGFYGTADENGARTARVVSYYNEGTRNADARPIEGVIAYVNLNTKHVYKLVDTGVVPIPPQKADLDMQAIGKQREAPKPLQIVQPQGASFEVNGSEVRWQKWRFRFSMTPREGLVLHTVGYEDEGRVRPILYRASLAEMVVPYGDPQAGWFFRNAFDEGEYGIGRLALSLEPQTDTPDNAVTFDAVFPGETGGGVLPVKRAVALYERDGGVLWKHADYSSFPFMHNESRRARDLVLAWFANVGNYEYGFNWIFHQDGSLEMEVQLTGIMAARGIDETENHPAHNGEGHGHKVAPGVEAVHHQHFFNFRLDMDVDGANNRLVEMNTQASAAGPQNPHNNSFTMIETPLLTERAAQRQMSMATSRKWKVINPAVKNQLGEPTGYILFPGENAVPYAAPTSSVRKRAGFLNAHLWATPYKQDEQFAAGDYINQSMGGEGLPKWTAANRPIDNQDLVLWYTLGVTHIPRPEEWPVMTCHRAGFKLMPAGFFARNPALDVPKPAANQ
ncbi:MAG TPA: primary-amine oxidase [Blastocatellia bacterium]|nr:primary-amine oxidase [Blastocatellia bacterium]